MRAGTPGSDWGDLELLTALTALHRIADGPDRTS